MTSGKTSVSSSLYKEVRGDGDPILCLHGLGANLYSWRHFITPFSQSHKLILVDFKGSGKSPKPLDTAYSIEDKANDIYDLILEENLAKLTLVGNSLGGAVALLVAIRLSKENPGRLSKLVLVDSAGAKQLLPVHLRLLRSFLGTAILYFAPSSLAALMTLRMCYYDRKKIAWADVQAYAAPFATAEGRYALLQTARNCIPPNADELISELRTITVPTLIVWGRQDKVIPLKVGERLRQLLPNSTLEVLEQCGHIPQEEKPEETVALISKFLAATV
jgi:pimeloyl-ACP methyl ester carboxylesterase